VKLITQWNKRSSRYL